MLSTVYQDAMSSNLLPTRTVQHPKLGSIFVCVGWGDGVVMVKMTQLQRVEGMVYSFSYK